MLMHDDFANNANTISRRNYYQALFKIIAIDEHILFALQMKIGFIIKIINKYYI